MCDIETVLFDLDETLCTFPKSRDDVLEEAFNRAGVDPFFDADDFERVIPQVHGKSAYDLRRKCFEQLATERDRPLSSARAVADAYKRREPESVIPLPGAVAAVRTLGDQFRLGVVTNGAEETQRRKLDALGLTSRFDTIVCATPETAIKPDPDPVHRALSAVDTDPSAAVLVGDSLESDVQAARNAGVHPIWIASGEEAHTVDHAVTVVESVADLARRPFPWQSE